METIQHYVFSSRPVGKVKEINTYLEEGDVKRCEADTALDHFNIGKYTILIQNDPQNRDHYISGSPEFFTVSDYDELHDFSKYPDSNFKPGEKLAAVFEEIFSSLKSENKMLYIYLHGFGNNADRERNKQVIPMTQSFYPHSANTESPVGKMIFLTWPSQGFLGYKNNEKHDVSKMANMVTVFLLKLYHFTRNKQNPLFSDWQPKIVFHAQSMGNRIFAGVVHRVNFLQEANMIKKNILDKFFHRFVMTGADLDKNEMADVDDDLREELHQWTDRVILFYNKKDRALWISRFIFGAGKRLGRHLDENTAKALPKNLDLIELNGKAGNFIGHNYFTEEPIIAKYICRALENYHFDGTELADRAKKIEFFIQEDRFESEYLA